MSRLARPSQGFLCSPDEIFQASTNYLIGQIESNYDETTDSFDAMLLKPELLRGVYAYGFERPSAIQQRAIMPIIKGEHSGRIHTHWQYLLTTMEGHDVIAQAQSGTGKTATFSISVL